MDSIECLHWPLFFINVYVSLFLRGWRQRREVGVSECVNWQHLRCMPLHYYSNREVCTVTLLLFTPSSLPLSFSPLSFLLFLSYLSFLIRFFTPTTTTTTPKSITPKPPLHPTLHSTPPSIHHDHLDAKDR